MRTMLMLMFLCLGLMPAKTDESFRTGTVMACETLAQAKRFVELGADAKAMEAVNKEQANPDSCATLRIEFVQSMDVTKMTYGNETYTIVEILVFGIESDTEMQMLEYSQTWYTFMVDGTNT